MFVDLTTFVDNNTLQKRKTSQQPRRTKNHSKQQAGGKENTNAKIRNLTQIKKSLKAEIDAAFRKLMLQ
jgi:hypothetical protein